MIIEVHSKKELARKELCEVFVTNFTEVNSNVPMAKLEQFVSLHSAQVANYWGGNQISNCDSWEIIVFKESEGKVICEMDHLYVSAAQGGAYPSKQVKTRSGEKHIPENWETCEILYCKYPHNFSVLICRNNNDGTVTTYGDTNYKLSCHVGNWYDIDTKLKVA